jgi:hypothetical protein
MKSSRAEMLSSCRRISRLNALFHFRLAKLNLLKMKELMRSNPLSKRGNSKIKFLRTSSIARSAF